MCDTRGIYSTCVILMDYDHKGYYHTGNCSTIESANSPNNQRTSKKVRISQQVTTVTRWFHISVVSNSGMTQLEKPNHKHTSRTHHQPYPRLLESPKNSKTDRMAHRIIFLFISSPWCANTFCAGGYKRRGGRHASTPLCEPHRQASRSRTRPFIGQPTRGISVLPGYC